MTNIEENTREREREKIARRNRNTTTDNRMYNVERGEKRTTGTTNKTVEEAKRAMY